MYNFTHIGCMYGRIDLKKQSTSTGLCTTSHTLVACMELRRGIDLFVLFSLVTFSTSSIESLEKQTI